MPDRDLSLLARKLASSGSFTPGDAAALLALPFTLRSVPLNTYLVRRRAAAELLDPAVRFRLPPQDRRAPHPRRGDRFQSLYLDHANHNVQTLSQAEIAVVPLPALRILLAERPAIARAVLMDMLVEASILREWVTNVGGRGTPARLAHLLCEFAYRLTAQGFTGAARELPMTQEHIGDALGLTSVHVDRSIKVLEADGLIVRAKRHISFADIAKLRAAADFNSLYLHHHSRPTLF